VLALAEVAPVFPPALVSHGLELTHTLRRAIGEKPVEATLWEELLALRRGPGADAFMAVPLSPRRLVDDLLLERAVEIRALVDAVRHNRFSHAGQPLNRVLRKGALRFRREVVTEETVPVAIRLGWSYVVIHVGDDHPRRLRDRIAAAFEDRARELRPLRPTRVNAPLLVSILPVPFSEALHLHRVGIEGPWLSWSETEGANAMGLLAAHHFVLEGPGFAALRADFRRRSKAMRVALGLDAGEEDLFEDLVPSEFGEGLSEELLALEAQLEAEAAAGGEFDYEADLQPRHTFAQDPFPSTERPTPERPTAELSPALESIAERRPVTWWGSTGLKGALGNTPLIRLATVNRGAFSFPDFCYAYCRAQHDAMGAHHPKYGGQGFTFVVPHIPRDSAGRQLAGRRAQPVLCSFRTRRGAPEGSSTFRRRLERRLDEADSGEDLLSQVFDDVLRIAVPDVLKALAVRLYERLPGDGGAFLSGRGLVSYIEVPDEFVDPFTEHGGMHEGFFGGPCQERGGISLMAIDRGFRRDLCAVGSGIFRDDPPMNFFWHRLAYFLGAAAM
jgi:hypothetical protein